MVFRVKNVFLLLVLVFSVTLFQPSLVIADDPKDTDNVDAASAGITNVLCQAIKIVQGPTGKTIAILVTISLAVGLFLGKITWGVAIAVAVGMGVLFGANTVVGYIAGSGADPCAGIS